VVGDRPGAADEWSNPAVISVFKKRFKSADCSLQRVMLSLIAITMIAKCSKNTCIAIQPPPPISLQTHGVYRGLFAGNWVLLIA
jgi:hypothetical protein